MLFVGILATAIGFERVGPLRLMSPGELLDYDYLTCQQPEFRTNILIHAAEDVESNVRCLRRLVRLTTAVTVLLLLEAAAFAAWTTGL